MTDIFFSVGNLKGTFPIIHPRRIVGYRHPLKTTRKKAGDMGKKPNRPMYFS
jgi:hypothetical protein